MDPATIAAAAIAVLAPYVKDAGQELLKTVGEVGVEKTKGLLTWLRQRFAGDPAAASDLARFEKDPVKFEAVLQSTLEERAEADTAFAADLTQRVNDVRSTIRVVQSVKDAEKLTGVEAENISAGIKIDVKQDATGVKEVTGVKAKNL